MYSITSMLLVAESCFLVGSVQRLRIGGRWFDAWTPPLSFQGLTVVSEIELKILSPLTPVSKMVMWESSQWIEKTVVVRNAGKRNLRKKWKCALTAAI